MHEILSLIVADLFDRSKGELSPKIQCLRAEVKKVIESESSIFGKLRRLVESFQDIMPEEKQRYIAALKALSTTSKLSREEIIATVYHQVEELKILEKGVLPALPDWRNELKVMEATTQEIRGELARLRERMVWLESEERRILSGMALRQTEAELAEKAMWELFRDIEAEITFVNRKVEEFTAEAPAAQPIAPRTPAPVAIPVVEKVGGEQKREISGSSVPKAIVGVEKAGGEQKRESSETSAPQDGEVQKKCLMCGGRMDFYVDLGMWQCYSCGHEELKTDAVPGEIEEKSEHTSAPGPAPASDSSFNPSPSVGVPWVLPSSNEDEEPKKKSSPSNNQPSNKKKPCPVCNKKMQWYLKDGTWRCSFCKYERRV